MTNTKGSCILEYLDHTYEYHSTKEGRSYWICWKCGDVEFENEDTSHGG